MTNFEKYKDEILSLQEHCKGKAVPALKDGKIVDCNQLRCKDCDLDNSEVHCNYAFVRWLYDEAKPDNKPEEPFEGIRSCENCVECCERYLLKFEPKPKRPEMKTCPCCGGRVGIVKHDDGEDFIRSCQFCKYGDIGEDEYPCIECTERYSNQFEPKPKEPKLKTCPFCGNRWEWRR